LERTSGDHLDQSFCSKQGQLQQVASDILLVLSISKDIQFHNVSEQPVPVFDHPHCKKKCFSLIFKLNLLKFSLCPSPLVCSLDNTEKSLAPSFLPSSTRHFVLFQIFGCLKHTFSEGGGDDVRKVKNLRGI